MRARKEVPCSSQKNLRLRNSGFRAYSAGPLALQPVIVTIRDNGDYVRVLLYSIIPLSQGGVSS